MTDVVTLRNMVDLRARVEQFYAFQMRRLDFGEAEAWANTFTQDAVFVANAQFAPTRGCAAIADAARQAIAELRAAGTVRRHWLGMCEVIPQSDGTVRVHSYALIVETPADGASTIRMSTTCEDVLVDDGELLLVRHRSVKRDDIVS